MLAALFAGIASAGTAFAATETVSLGSNEDTGPAPGPFLQPPAVENPLSFSITYTATPVQPLEILQSLYCDHGATGIPEKKETVTPPITTTLTAPTGSDSCSLEVSAETPVDDHGLRHGADRSRSDSHRQVPVGAAVDAEEEVQEGQEAQARQVRQEGPQEASA